MADAALGGTGGALCSCRFGEGTESRGPERLLGNAFLLDFRQTFCNAWENKAEVVSIYRPIHSMYAIYAYIDSPNHPNVGIYGTHGAFGIYIVKS